VTKAGRWADKTPKANFGKTFRTLRDAAGLTLRQAEAQSGVSNGYISLIEHDRIKEPSPHAIYALARVYGVDYWRLMRFVGYPVPER
jgi:transcriptional regulator with XRE-family HTH domain